MSECHQHLSKLLMAAYETVAKERLEKINRLRPELWYKNHLHMIVSLLNVCLIRWCLIRGMQKPEKKNTDAIGMKSPDSATEYRHND